MKSGSARQVHYPRWSDAAQPIAHLANSRTALHDPRWPTIAAALSKLRDRGRFAVRIVDADCGAGSLLLHAVHHARTLGFTAIEGRGIDGSPALIGRASAAAKRQRDPGIGVAFEMADVLVALSDEYDLPADIVLWNGACRHSVDQALSRAGNMIIRDVDTGAQA